MGFRCFWNRGDGRPPVVVVVFISGVLVVLGWVDGVRCLVGDFLSFCCCFSLIHCFSWWLVGREVGLRVCQFVGVCFVILVFCNCHLSY